MRLECGMETLLTRFIAALRLAEVPVSPAETLDALRVLRVIGIHDRKQLRNALALTLAKSSAEKERFAACFDTFFHDFAFNERPQSDYFAEVSLADIARVIPPGRALERAAMMFSESAPQLGSELVQGAALSSSGRMTNLRDKRHLVDDLLAWLEVPAIKRHLLQNEDLTTPATRSALQHLVQYFTDEVQAFVDRRYALTIDPSGRKALVDTALEANLAQLPPAYFTDAGRVVAILAEALRQKHRQRQRRSRRGSLDLPWTLRRNLRYDGVPFHLRFRRRKHQQATLYVVCDVSGSVSRVARFLLLFLHHLADALPELRLFVFSSELGEITELMRTTSPERAVEQALSEWGRGSTDYGHAFARLEALITDKLDRRSSMLILGDARSNLRDPRTRALASLARRLRQVLWLNPEPPEQWGEGDSLMRQYGPFCRRVDRCARLADLERFAERLLLATGR